jgi:hypothetical protein
VTLEDDLTPEQEAALEALVRAEIHPDPAEAARRREEAARRLPELIPRAAIARVEARVLAELWARTLAIPDRLHAKLPNLTPEMLKEIRRLVIEALPGGEPQDHRDDRDAEA